MKPVPGSRPEHRPGESTCSGRLRNSRRLGARERRSTLHTSLPLLAVSSGMSSGGADRGIPPELRLHGLNFIGGAVLPKMPIPHRATF